MAGLPLSFLAIACTLAGGTRAALVRDEAPAGVLTVTVRDAVDRPVAGANVQVAGHERVRRATTGLAGSARFGNLRFGEYRVQVRAPGYRLVEQTAGIAQEEARLTVVLLREFREDVDVHGSRPASISPRVLLPEQIAALPDDPDEMQRALEELAGPGAIILVNGFRGGRLPPKSQIGEIRIELDPFTARNHDAGVVRVEIVTKPGLAGWTGDIGGGGRGGRWNARHAFAPVRGQDGYHRLQLSLAGPVRPGTTSMGLSLGWRRFDGSIPLNASGLTGPITGLVDTGQRNIDGSVRLEHGWFRGHMLRLEYHWNGTDEKNLGAGELALPERGYSQKTRSQWFRLSDSGVLGRRVFNDFRLQVHRESRDALPNLAKPSIDVLGSFNGGGAPYRGAWRLLDTTLMNDVDFSIGRHGLRAGVAAELIHVDGSDETNRLGTLTFSDLEAYRAERPALLTRRVGDPRLRFWHGQFGWYVEDTLILQKGRLSVTGGIRHEFQSKLNDWVNLAPRIFVIWTLPFDRRTRVKAGGGVFHEWLDAATREVVSRLDGTRQAEIVIRGDGSSSAAPLDAGLRVARLASNVHMPQVHRVSIEAERHVAGGSVHLLARAARSTSSTLFRSRLDETGGAGERSVAEVVSTGRSRSTEFYFHGSAFQKRIILGVDYWWGRLDNDADAALALPADSRDLATDFGPAGRDVRHRLIAGAYLNFGRGLRASVGWRLASGAPYTVTTGRDDNGDGVLNDRPAGFRRNSKRGGAHSEVDLSVAWTRRFGEVKPEQPHSGAQVVQRDESAAPHGLGDPGDRRVGIGLYVRISNLMNRISPTSYVGVLASPRFGEAAGAKPPRRVEAGFAVGF